MADGYWNRQQPLHPSAGMLKRPRPDYVADLPPSGMPYAREAHNYLARDDDRARMPGSAYERYLIDMQPHNTSGEARNFGEVAFARAVGGGMPGHPLADPVALGRPGAAVPDLAPNGRGMDFGGQLPLDAKARSGREAVPLPPDASSTLYIERLPSNCTRREVSHIFRPFVGFKEVRLVSKESRHRGGDPLILCFVDFINPACAATALSALQGYKMDEHDPDSPSLRLQFCKNPGPRSGGSGPRGKR